MQSTVPTSVVGRASGGLRWGGQHWRVEFEPIKSGVDSARDDEFGKPQRSPQGLEGRSNQGLYVIIDEVEEHCARAKEAGAEILLEPTAQEYGGVIYTCRDLEGHVWSFGSFDPWAE
jgi:uncharacterized glyoxalase superfamily protein PhnB